jgi:hypothetical protein
MIPRFLILVLTPVLAAGCAAPAIAAEPAPSGPGTVYRLTPAEADAAIADGARRRDDAFDSGSVNGDNRIHGTVGAVIGTGGTRGIFGAAAIPLGDKANASVAFESSRSSRRRTWY